MNEIDLRFFQRIFYPILSLRVCLIQFSHKHFQGRPPYKQVKHLLEIPKKLKKLITKKSPKFKNKNIYIYPNFEIKIKKKKKKIIEVKSFQFLLDQLFFSIFFFFLTTTLAIILQFFFFFFSLSVLIFFFVPTWAVTDQI